MANLPTKKANKLAIHYGGLDSGGPTTNEYLVGPTSESSAAGLTSADTETQEPTLAVDRLIRPSTESKNADPPQVPVIRASGIPLSMPLSPRPKKLDNLIVPAKKDDGATVETSDYLEDSDHSRLSKAVKTIVRQVTHQLALPLYESEGSVISGITLDSNRDNFTNRQSSPGLTREEVVS
ncbi:unnamed protein product [Protopolystoma xenopodis]|uniref:Uncharacterized protein n=1 Tax=Protopolystoma xenopodis TaxID=117903 RepID=A0A3S5AXG9_9PLAT|nr:unnamed protein product [Protopolystoma xenopodis]